MSLGIGALKIGQEPQRLRHSKEVSMATLRAVTTPNKNSPRCLERGGTREQEGASEPLNFPNNPKHRRNLTVEPSPGVFIPQNEAKGRRIQW